MSAIHSMVSGIGGMVTGAFNFTKGKMQEAGQSIGHIQDIGKSIFLGLCGVSLRGGIRGLDAETNGEVMKYSLTAMAGMMGGLGAIQLTKGIKQRNVYEMIQGAATTATGVAGSLLVYSLDSRIIIAAHQASILGATSSFIGVLGFKDLMKGRYGSGLCKMALGIAGVASAVFYVYHAFPATTLVTTEPELAKEPEKNIPIKEEHLFSCLEPHKKELEKMYKNPHQNLGQWKRLGAGQLKFTFTHEECPGWVVKIPRGQWLKGITEDYENLESMRSMASKFDRISLPKSHLYPIENGAVLVQEMFNLERFQGTVEQQETKTQFDDFARAAGLCDVYPRLAHNAGILTGSTPPKMGVIDFNCRDYEVAEERYRRRFLEVL